MPKNKYFPDVTTDEGYAEFLVNYGHSTGIGREMYTCASEMGASLRFFQDNTDTEELEEEQTKFFENMAKAFIYGNPISSRPGFAPLNLPHLPERTGNAETDLQNFNDYFQEFFNELPNVSGYEFLSFKEDLENAFNTYVQKNPLKDFAKVAGRMPSFADTRFLIESTLDSDHLLEGDRPKTEKMNRFTLFRSLTFDHAIRKKPEWYEFGKRFNMWREKRALDKLENNLKALGFPQETLDKVKNLEVQNNEEVKGSIKQTAIERMAYLKFSVNKAGKNLDDEYTIRLNSKEGKKFLTETLRVYKNMKTLHDNEVPQTDDEKKYFQKEEKLFDAMKIKIKNTMEIVTPEDKKFFDSLFEKDADVEDLYDKREMANRPIERETVSFDEKMFDDYSIVEDKMEEAIDARDKKIDGLQNQQNKQQLNNNILQEDEVQGPQQG